MIEAKKYNMSAVKKAYDARSWLYSKLVAPFEHKNHLTAIEMAGIQPGENVLEVAVGPGMTFVELAKHVGKDTMLYGVDISTNMLQLTRQRLHAQGFSKFELREADSRNLPFEENSFDVVYNGYMLDLIPLADIPQILAEFKRVLRTGGRLVLLNMSKKDDTMTFREKLYEYLPSTFVLYGVGGCRPVLMEKMVKDVGYRQTTRTYLGGRSPSEIVIAVKG